jgi:urease accessory protein
MKKMIVGSVAVLGMASMAMAHPGHSGETGLLAGAMHPLVGIDHVIAALAVGIWAARVAGKLRWILPTVFVATLFAATLFPHALSTSAAEAGIVASLFVLGLLAVFSWRMPVSLGIAVTALFAVFHGSAHASEMPASVSSFAYAFGLTVSSAMICFAGTLSVKTWLFLHADRRAVSQS